MSFYRVKDERLFNVDINGERAATGILRDKASEIQQEWRATGKGTCYVYLMDKPLEGRKRAYTAPRIPRLPSLRVSAKERKNLRDKLLADGTMSEDSDETV